MSSKSKLSRLACKDINRKDTVSTKEAEPVLSEAKINNLNTTPARKSLNREEVDDERLSPFFMRFTQDNGDDDLDVVWDWDSPRSKGNRSILRKRVLHSSPKMVPSKHVPNDKTLPRFNSLKAELEQLANQLHDQDAQDNLFDTSFGTFVEPNPPVSSSDNKDLFDDDSFDEEMIKCSQQVEEAYNLNRWCSSIMNNNKEFKSSIQFDTTIKDDSFDVLLEDIKDEDIEKLSQASSSCSQPTILTKSIVTVSSPRSISRTTSVPTDFFAKPISTISNSLVSRTKSEETGKSDLIQCSPEEIEKKRQEARAKLEFKKKQQEIEKKRLEALERLRRNRMQKKIK